MNNVSDIVAYVFAIGGIVLFVLCYAKALAEVKAAVTAIPYGFIRSEHEDVYRIGQTNVEHPHETRLYVYACVIRTTIYILTVGDKSTQQLDINACRAKARELKSQLASEPQTDEENENG